MVVLNTNNEHFRVVLLEGYQYIGGGDNHDNNNNAKWDWDV